MQKRKRKTWWTLDKSQVSTFDVIWSKCPADITEQWNTKHKNQITKAFVGYILRIYTFVDVCRLLKAKEVPGNLSLWRYIRLQMVQNFNTVLGLKLMLLRCQKRRMVGEKSNILKEIKDNDLFKNDMAIFYSLRRMKLHDLLIEKIKSLPIEVPNAVTARDECSNCLKDIEVFLGKFTTAKLRFIYKSNNLKHSDMLNDLNLKATEAFYHSTPWLTEEHRKSTVKRAGHNHGIKLIKYYTAPERARSRRKADGTFENTVMLFNEVTHDDSDSFSLYRQSDLTDVNITNEIAVKSEEASFFDDEKVSNSIALKTYIYKNKVELPTIRLLSLMDDSDFVKFAEVNSGYIFQTTENVYEELGSEKYYEVVAKYLNQPIDQVMAVILDLQNVLTPVY